MRRIGRALLALAVLVAAGLVLAPKEPLEMPPAFEPRRFGEGIGVYLETMESRFDDIRPDSHNRVIWAGEQETRTALSIVYFHGFSASSQEIRPVPDLLAQAFGANLVYTRFRGHGRDSDAMGEDRRDGRGGGLAGPGLARTGGGRHFRVAQFRNHQSAGPAADMARRASLVAACGR
jgi:hypothetical protein